MRALLMIGFAAGVVVAGLHVAHAQKWQDATAQCLGTTAEWSSKIELADVDGDGLLDILVANGGNYSAPGPAEPTRVWKNNGNWSASAPHCSEISAQAVGGFTGLSRVIKAADIGGATYIFTGGAYQTQARLYRRDGVVWTDATAQLPQQLTSIGDAEFGDVDGDGDLDIVIADWGATNPGAGTYVGGPTRLYRNDGTNHFTDDTAALPSILVGWSWDIELVDVDNDWDLDVLVSCKLCTTSLLFRNDGTGHFTNDANALPHFGNNYEFEAMDVNNDGFLDLATINDGPNGTDHLFINRGDGTFADETSMRLTGTANPAEDDNAAVWLDADNDGDADLLVASLSGPDRLSLNDGSGHFTLAPGATPNDTPGSLGIAVGDLDGDGRLDVVQAQGEVAFPEKVQLATTAIAIDTQPPVIAVETLTSGVTTRAHARVHDHQSPSRLSDWQSVVLTTDFSHQRPLDTPMHWYGEYLWVADLPATPFDTYHVCATDRRGNKACSPDGPMGDGPRPSDDAGIGGTMKPGGCCDTGGSSSGALLPALLVLSARIRRRSRDCGNRARGRRSA